MNAALRQIGNAVPPLMAKAIAVEMMKALRKE
jgi:site-specific DNA-cytosine methylase